MSWIIPERVITKALNDGLAMIRAAYDDDTIDELLERMLDNIEDDERAEVKEWLAEHEPKVVLGFPLLGMQLPCWAVIIRRGDQVQQYLGDQGVEHVFEDGSTTTEDAERWQATFGILVCAEDGQTVSMLAAIAKFILADGRRELSEWFRHGFKLGESDLKPEDLGDGGRFRFCRVIDVIATYDQTDADSGDQAEEITESGTTVQEQTYVV